MGLFSKKNKDNISYEPIKGETPFDFGQLWLDEEKPADFWKYAPVINSVLILITIIIIATKK